MLEEKIRNQYFSEINLAAKGVLFPVLYFTVLLIISGLLVRFWYTKFTEERKVLDETKKIENVLNDKVSYLKDNQSKLPSYVNVLSAALPNNNPAIVILSQIKSLQAENLITISNFGIATGKDTQDSRKSLMVSLSLEGDINQIFNFIKGISNILPISNLSSVVFTRSGNVYTADVAVSAYWEAFPTEVPPATESIVKLDREELGLLTGLYNMKYPTYNQMSPEAPSSRINPFQ